MALDWLAIARPLFTTLGPNIPWTRTSVDARVAQAVEDGADTVMAFVQDEGYALWPSRFAPHAPRAGGADMVAWWVESAHAAGLRFVAQWMGVHVQTVQTARHPSWLQRDTNGAPAAAMCLNSPFGDALAGQVHEIVDRYPVDGVYFDGLYARQGGCTCDGCRGRFETVTGRRLERSHGWASDGARAGEHWLDFGAEIGPEDPELATFRFATVQGFVARVAEGVRQARPGTAFILDTLGIGGAFWPNAQDPAALSQWVDAFALECYPDQLREPLWLPAFETRLLACEGRRPVWMLRWIARDPDGDLVSVPAATVETHLASAMLHDARPTIVEMNLYSIDRSLAPVIRHGMETVRRLDDWRRGAVPTVWASLLSSASLRRTSAEQGRPRRAFDPLAGAWLALTEAHLPVQMVTEAELEAQDLPDGTAVLVLPDVGGIPPELAGAIVRLVEDHGLGVVATHRTASEPGSALAALLGVTPAGSGYRAGRIGTEAIGGGELVNYLSFASDHPITAGLADRPASYPGAFVRLVRTDGAALGWIHDADFEAMDGERWFGWYPGAPASPLGVAREVGKGRVVYWAAPLDSQFFRQGRAEFGELLARSCRWVARTGPDVEVEAPVTVEARSWSGPDGMVIALANRTTNDLYAIGPGIAIGAASSSAGGAGGGEPTLRSQHPRVVIALADVVVDLPWAEAAPPLVECLSGGDVTVDVVDGRLRIELARLGAQEALRVRMSRPRGSPPPSDRQR